MRSYHIVAHSMGLLQNFEAVSPQRINPRLSSIFLSRHSKNSRGYTASRRQRDFERVQEDKKKGKVSLDTERLPPPVPPPRQCN